MPATCRRRRWSRWESSQPDWLTSSPTDGIVPPGGSANIQVTFDATDLFGGGYDGAVRIETNDPAAGLITIPAQTMARDQGAGVTSALPMGSVYEGALFLLFEIMVLQLRDLRGSEPEAMRARHTNLE